MGELVPDPIACIGLLDHLVTSEYRIFGPPGTGKTTSLARHINRAVDRFGENSVMATSFSRATVAELAGRDVPIDLNRIGTLHSLCFHALGKPGIAEVHGEEWNRENPSLIVTPVSRQPALDGEHSLEEERTRPGDYILNQLNFCRAVMLPPDKWPAAVQGFNERWLRFKKANSLFDFADLLETAVRDFSVAPGKPAVILADEAQDLNRLQLTLVRRWSKAAQYLVLAGDDDQTIYSWAGADPDAILEPDIPEDHKFFLTQSSRVPRAVHSAAEKLIHKVSRRQAKIYLPRPENGQVIRLSTGAYRSPEYGIFKSADRHLSQGKSIMFLAACSFMLRPIIAVLRKNGIPFHNPYRKSNGFWNQLRMGSRLSAANRILSLLVAHPDFGEGGHRWRNADVALWTEWVRRAGMLQADAREILNLLPPMRDAVLDSVFEPNALLSLLAALNGTPPDLLNWWRNRLAPQFRNRTHFPADIVARRGIQTLRNPPKVIVGTIHSVKGGQADVVYLFPDLSKSGESQYRRPGTSRDAVIRTFYVGATRAREILYICAPETGASISI